MIFRSVFQNSQGYRLTVFLPSDSALQPHDFAQRHVDNDEGLKRIGPWKRLETERYE